MNNRVFQILLIGLVACPVFIAQADDLPPVIDTPGIGAAPPTMDGRATQPVRRQTAVPEKQDVESRLSRLERVLASGTLVNMSLKLDSVQDEVQHMRGGGEELAHEVEAIKRRQRDLYLDIDRRLTEIETALKNLQQTATPSTGGNASSKGISGSQAVASGALTSKQPSASAAPAIVAVPAPTSSATTATEGGGTATAAEPVKANVSPLEEQSDYEAALAILRSGDYENAQQAFSKFVETYPQGAFADNAYYWQGEANYVMRRYKDAIASFNKVLTLFPDSAKVPAALLKTGFSHYSLKQWNKAREVLEKVKTQYPQGSVAQLAEKRLHRMKIEGH